MLVLVLVLCSAGSARARARARARALLVLAGMSDATRHRQLPTELAAYLPLHLDTDAVLIFHPRSPTMTFNGDTALEVSHAHSLC